MEVSNFTQGAQTINRRLKQARIKFPNSSFTNEIERRIISMTAGLDLVIVRNGEIQLSRSAKKWAAVPEYRAQAIIDEIKALGTVKDLQDRAGMLLEYMGEDNTYKNQKALLEGQFNDEVKKNDVWEMAYDMRSQNQRLYDLFHEMRGVAERDWEHDRDEYTDILRDEILYGEMDDIQRPGYGLNVRKENLKNAARAIGRFVSQPGAKDDPEGLARLIQNFAQAEYGTTKNDVFYPADYSELTSDQVRSILRKFLK